MQNRARLHDAGFVESAARYQRVTDRWPGDPE